MLVILNPAPKPVSMIVFRLCVLFLFLTGRLALPSQTLDQVQLYCNGGSSARNLESYSIFQSFTAGLTGTLTEIDIGFFNLYRGDGMVLVYSSAGALLQSKIVEVFNKDCENYFTAHFIVSIPVYAGQSYSLQFRPGPLMPDPYGVQIRCPGNYAGGNMGFIDPTGHYHEKKFDMVFRTVVTAPAGVTVMAAPDSSTVSSFSAFTCYFDSGMATLSQVHRQILDRLADSLITKPYGQLELRGHADSTGNSGAGLKLSQKRADAVKRYLVSKGVNAESLVTIGYGSRQPLAFNTTAQGRARNRRVNLLVVPDPGPCQD